MIKMDPPSEDKLKSFLNLFWLRPENGLLYAFRSRTFDKFKMKSPSIDISCGDGLTTFIHLGGILDPNFDTFKSTQANVFKHSSFVDIFDSYDSNYKVNIIKKSDVQVDYGTDWKQNLLDKASKLGLYKNLVLHDNNNLPLPFPDGHFRTVYSNAIYWIENPKALLLDIRRILKDDGILVIELMTPYFLETLEEMKDVLSEEAMTIMDRQRSTTVPGVKDFNEWKHMIKECNFRIKDHGCVYPNKLLVDIWNVGLRPISHLMVQMSNQISPEERSRIKQEWVEIFTTLFKPLLSLEQNYDMERAPYVYFVLEKDKIPEEGKE